MLVSGRVKHQTSGGIWMSRAYGLWVTVPSRLQTSHFTNQFRGSEKKNSAFTLPETNIAMENPAF